MDEPFEWEEETKIVDHKVYQKMGQEGILRALAFGRKVPKQYAKPDGTVLAGIKVEEWDGL